MNLDRYKYIFCDIDRTLIYGWSVDFMHHSWNLLRCNWFTDLCMMIQTKFRLYKVNKKLVDAFREHHKICFLTARKDNPYTHEMIVHIIGEGCKDFYPYVWIESLGTDNAPKEKCDYIRNLLSWDEVSEHPVCFIDDSKETRAYVGDQLDIDIFDPTPMYEEEIR